MVDDPEDRLSCDEIDVLQQNCMLSSHTNQKLSQPCTVDKLKSALG